MPASVGFAPDAEAVPGGFVFKVAGGPAGDVRVVSLAKRTSYGPGRSGSGGFVLSGKKRPSDARASGLTLRGAMRMSKSHIYITAPAPQRPLRAERECARRSHPAQCAPVRPTGSRAAVGKADGGAGEMGVSGRASLRVLVGGRDARPRGQAPGRASVRWRAGCPSPRGQAPGLTGRAVLLRAPQNPIIPLCTTRRCGTIRRVSPREGQPSGWIRAHPPE